MTQTEGRSLTDSSGAAASGGNDATTPITEVVSFATLYRREYRGLVSLAWGLTGSRETAEDVAQEALLSLHRRWESGHTVDNPAAYVRRSCANLSVSWIRRRMAETKALFRLGVPQGSIPGLDDGTAAFWSEVRRLPQRQAQVVALFYGYDLDVAEVAETLQISPGTAKTHLHRARKALADRLGTGVDEEVE